MPISAPGSVPQPADLLLAERGSLLMSNNKTMDYYHGGTLHGLREQEVKITVDRQAIYTLQIRNKSHHHKIDYKVHIIPTNIEIDHHNAIPISHGKVYPQDKYVLEFHVKADEKKTVYIELRTSFIGFVAEYEVELYSFEKRPVIPQLYTDNESSSSDESIASPILHE
jgi:hypothetical protein